MQRADRRLLAVRIDERKGTVKRKPRRAHD
jgi:hypothetical protein